MATINMFLLFAAICDVENGPREGEAAGRSCITQPVIDDYNERHKNDGCKFVTMDMIAASEDWESTVAVDHLRSCRRRWILHTGVEPSPSDLARCWRAGFRGAMAGGYPKYGERVANTYQDKVDKNEGGGR